MSLVQPIATHIGSTCVVFVQDDIVTKRIPFTNLIWIREQVALSCIRNSVTGETSRYVIQHRGSVSHSVHQSIQHRDIHFPCLPGTLADVIKLTPDGMTAEQIDQLAIDLITGLAFCHRRGVWHRDIKQNNIMLTADGRATLIDFGHAVSARPGMKLDWRVCFFSYRAPEVFQYQIICDAATSRAEHPADAYDEKIDVWSLGVVLIEIATNRRVRDMFLAKSQAEFERMIINNPQQFAAKLRRFYGDNTTLPPSYDWILDMVALLPADRPHMIELLHTLRQEHFAKDCPKPKLALELLRWGAKTCAVSPRFGAPPAPAASAPDQQPAVFAVEEECAPDQEPVPLHIVMEIAAHYVEVFDLAPEICQSAKPFMFLRAAGFFCDTGDMYETVLAYCLIASAGAFDHVIDVTTVPHQIASAKHNVMRTVLIEMIDSIMRVCGSCIVERLFT